MRQTIIATAAILLTAVPAFATADGPDFFEVHDVADYDSLNLRAEPNPKARLTGYVPHDAKGVPNLGCVTIYNGRIQPDTDAHIVGSTRWCKVQWGLSVGWANARFLKEGGIPSPAASAASKPAPVKEAQVPASEAFTGHASLARMGLPAQVVKGMQVYVEDCKAFDGAKGFAKNDVDLNGDGTNDWVLDYEKAECDGTAMPYCGSGGCTYQVFVSKAAGKWEEAYGAPVRGYRYVTKGKRTVVRFDLHGSACGKGGADECFKDVDFSRRR